MFGAGIAKGMATTLKHFFGKKETIQYPEQRAHLHTGFRGLPRLVYDETPEDLRCVACSICANACPVHVIHIDTHRGEDRKLVLDRFDLEAGGCIFCGLCVEACPFEALTMMHGFELASYNREQLLWTKEMLAIKGTERTLSDMERIHGPNEKEEKKPAPAAAPRPPAEATAAAKAVPPSNGAATTPSEAAATAKPDPVTEPAQTMSEAVPGATGGEEAQAIADAEVAPPRVEVAMPPEGAGVKAEPGAPPGPADSVSQPPGPVPPSKTS
jgi:NADH-quinone oxidoreductase subunit I